MKRFAAIIALLSIVGLLSLWIYISSEPPAEVAAGAPSAAGNSAGSGPRQSAVERMANGFATPITFYGRVLDQHGAPVAGAIVRGSASVSMGGDTTKTSTTTDASGSFTLKSKGMSLFVSVDKPGYYHIYPDKMPGMVSEKGFDYAEDLGNVVHQPDASNPVDFRLYKSGTIEPLNRLKPTSRRLSRSGEAVQIALDPDQGGRHRITLSCKTESDTTQDGRYSWRFEIGVISGGLQPYTDIFQFEAPLDGYKQTDAVDMNHSLPRPQWVDSVRRAYFVRFDDNTFARINVLMVSGGDHFARVECYHNPKAGSRNLEADPSKR